MVRYFKNMWGWVVAVLFASVAINRARFFVDKFTRYLIKGDTMLDLGCGTGHLGVYSKVRYGQQVTLADIKPPLGYIGQWLFGVPCAKRLSRQYGLPYVVCNGNNLPFTDRVFDTILVAFVLHHAADPDAILAEAVRVARTRIIVFEDIPNTPIEARLNCFADALGNLEFIGHPHSNRTQSEWERIFLSQGLTLVYVESWTGKLFSLPLFPNTIFVLEKRQTNSG